MICEVADMIKLWQLVALLAVLGGFDLGRGSDNLLCVASHNDRFQNRDF
jgi:hypothetical protein